MRGEINLKNKVKIVKIVRILKDGMRWVGLKRAKRNLRGDKGSYQQVPQTAKV